MVPASFHKTTEGKHFCIFPYLYSLILPIARVAVLSTGEKALYHTNLQTDLVSVYKLSNVRQPDLSEMLFIIHSETDKKLLI